MPFTLRQFTHEDNFCQHLSLDAFEQVIPPAHVEAALAAYGPMKTRNRRVTPRAVVWLVIPIHLFSHASLAHVFGYLARGLRFLTHQRLVGRPLRSLLPMGVIQEL